MYVRHKVIKGHVYYYLVRGERQGGKVKQKVVRYLGKQPGTASGSGGGYVPSEAQAAAPVHSLGTTTNSNQETADQLSSAQKTGGAPEQNSNHTAHRTPVSGLLLRRDEGRRYSDDTHRRYDIIKVEGGIYWQHYQNERLVSQDFSPRPYRLGQPSDGMVDDCVHALFILWCRATSRDPHALYHKAYGHESFTTPTTYNVDDQEEHLHYAKAEGIDIPPTWGHKEFQGLLDSLTEINEHALVKVLKEEPEPVTSRKVSPSLSTAVMNRERARTLVDQALTDLNDALAAGNSDALKAYLNAMARFRTYSLSNQMSIAAQCPHATLVAGFREWKKRGYYVRKGEKGILITAPVIRKAVTESSPAKDERDDSEDTNAVVGYRPVYVFDISQTEGEPLPALEIREASGDPGAHTDKLKAFIAANGIALEYATDLRYGVMGSSHGGRIRIREGLPAVEEFTTLVHEVAHEFLHHSPAKRAGKTVHETEAEAVAHVVSSAIGLQTTDATADYIRLYQGTTETLRASLESIRRTANTILDGLDLASADS